MGDTEAGRRFVANTPEEVKLLEDLVSEEAIGRKGRVSHQDGRNLFVPA